MRIFTTAMLSMTMMLVSAPNAFGALVTENFDSDPGWIATNTSTPGSSNANYGFSNTGNVTGSAGEMGGTIARVDVASSYGVDLGIGGLDLDDAFEAHGSFKVIDDPGDVRIGFFQRAQRHQFQSSGWDWDFMGLGLTRWGSNAVRTQLYQYDTTDGRTFTFGGILSNGGTHTFDFAYDPNIGNGQISLSIDGGVAITQNLSAAERSGGMLFDTFGMTMNGDGVNASFDGEVYFDSVSFTSNVPEPASVALVGLGGVVMLMRKR